jgi:hypothetical protein
LSDALNIAVLGACPYPVPQGSQIFLRNTALAFQHAGHAPRLVTYGYGIGEDASGLPLHRAANVPGARQTAPHDKLAAYLVECGCAQDRVHVVPPAIDIDAFVPAQPARTDASVVYAGNLDEYQNLGLLYRAMDRVLASCGKCSATSSSSARASRGRVTPSSC